MVQTLPFLFIFALFAKQTNLSRNDKSVDVVLATRTPGGMMVGAEASTELWRHPSFLSFLCLKCVSIMACSTVFLIRWKLSFGKEEKMPPKGCQKTFKFFFSHQKKAKKKILNFVLNIFATIYLIHIPLRASETPYR